MRISPWLLGSTLVLGALAAGCAQGGFGDDGGSGGMDAGLRDSGPSGSCGPDLQCAPGLTCCDGECIDTRTSLTDCGACGAVCAGRGNACVAGVCRCGSVEACTGTELCCGSRCANILDDPMDCGDCGNRCPSGQVCEDRVCQAPPCPTPCGAGETCVGGSCRCGTGPACAPGRACCGGACLDVSSDRNNCGLCGNACAGAQVCQAGTCTTDVPCEPGCGPGETCVGGTCRCGAGGRCGPGLRCCTGECVDTTTNVGHCGACGRVCSGTDSCCSGSCVNTRGSDPNHCGACGRACDSRVASECTDGVCTCQGASACRPAESCPCVPPMPPFTSGGCTGICF